VRCRSGGGQNIMDVMKLSPKFILLVFLSHAFIPIGFGHTGAILGVTIIFAFEWVPTLIAGPSASHGENIIGVVGTLCAAGYLTLLAAIAVTRVKRLVFYFTGVAVLSTAILLFYLFGNSIVFDLPIIFAIPFFVIALLPLYYTLLKKCWHWALD
jgi:hypothetical protein